MRLAEQTQEDLIKGNRRFVAELGNNSLKVGAVRRYWLVPRQEPYAIVGGAEFSPETGNVDFFELGD